jgi:PAS domain S-box-containing protein
MHSITNGIPYDIEHRCRRADGVYRWFQVRALPVLDAGSQITGWYVLLTDIDDRKRLEDAVRASERNLNQIISTIPALAWSASPDGTADFFNQHYLDYLGLTLEEARGWGWSAAVHTDDLSGLAATWQAISASGKAGEAEARLRRFDGQYRWFLFRVNPSSDESGSIVKWYGVNTDIEDRKRVETELRVKEERYRELFNSVPVALLEIDSQKRTEMLNDLHRQGVTDVEAYLDAHPDFERRAIDASIIKEVNQQTVELFGGRDASALIGASTARLLDMSPGALRRGTVSRFRGEKLFQHELKLQTLDHTIDVLLTVARPDVSRNFLALTDITKLKTAEDALRRSERRYRQLFEFMPIAMWQLDLSEIAEMMNKLRAEGVTDLDDHFGLQPEAPDLMMDALIAVDVNECAVKMFGAGPRPAIGAVGISLENESGHFPPRDGVVVPGRRIISGRDPAPDVRWA